MISSCGRSLRAPAELCVIEPHSVEEDGEFSLDIKEVVMARQSPWQNPYAERAIGSIG